MKSVVEEADPIVSASDTDGFAGMTGDEQNVFGADSWGGGQKYYIEKADILTAKEWIPVN